MNNEQLKYALIINGQIDPIQLRERNQWCQAYIGAENYFMYYEGTYRQLRVDFVYEQDMVAFKVRWYGV